MEFKIKKNDFLKSFKKINKIITKNTIFPILENIILKINQNILKLTSSTLEIELNTYIDKKYFTYYTGGCITVSGKKIFNICRNTKDNTELHFQLINEKIHIKISNSLFKINTISCNSFPIFKTVTNKEIFLISQLVLKETILLTYFSIANNDIRNTLNGMLLEYKNNYLYGVTTDGHRLSMYKTHLNLNISYFSVIINKKSILELYRLLIYTTDTVRITIHHHYISFQINEILMITKLINGNFPNYNDVILNKYTYCILVSVEKLKESLLKTSILCNTTFKGVCLNFSKNLLTITSNNQEDEESCDSFFIDYNYPNISFSVNVFYLLDVLNVLKSNKINIIFNMPISSIQIQSNIQKEIKYIIMPLKI
ncbi:Beta sliding clamp [Buchnera aphidicola (Cinara kochiana kochiana)]|uniref:Beta sliding clamp n=1 Tax=Buchnera aphidicola (Cinara kochiana kochiana) TaxID=2518976 RepID=A0A451D551_9GAMM|nr:DNA polymerase III subunit beta [Buchnera aphidicola]VFP80932.1 Beta sliding clamp [Buchnera aphidicola (Cinara kochiana kochiana)]